MGARREPLYGSMSWPGEGMARRKLSESGLYAWAAGWRRRILVRTERDVGSVKNMVR